MNRAGKPRIAICDLLFCWPPDAGAFVDVANVAARLAREAEVLLVVPKIDSLFSCRHTVFDRILGRYSRFFLRGAVDEALPFPVRHLQFTGKEFAPRAIGRRFEEVLSEFNPDHTLIANGWHLKPHLVKALARYNPILRIYAHEFLCAKADGWFFRRGRTCERNYLNGGLKDYLGCLACCTTFYARFPAVRWVQEYVRSGAYKPGYAKVAKEALGIASTVIVYNTWTADLVRPYNPRVRIIPSGVDTKEFRPAAERSMNRTVVTLVPGRVGERHKGRDFLAKVIRLMEKQRPNMVFHITGMRSYFSGPNVVEKGWLSQSELPGLYQAADVAFIPSLWPEPLGIIALEAAASGLPIVASEVGGLKELVQHGRTGFLVRPGDVDAATEVLSRLCDDRELREQLGREARAMCEENFGWDVIFERHYRRLFLLTTER